MSVITKPLLLDSTGQTMATALQTIASHTQGSYESAQQAAASAESAETSATSAATSASNTATYMSELKTAIAALPDGSAVSETVAEHTVQLGNLGIKIDDDIIGGEIKDTYGFTSRNNMVLRGDSVTERSTVEGFSTSDYIDIPSDVEKLTYTGTYDAAGYFAGLVLYNEAIDTIVACFGGSGTVNLSDYPTAKKFAYCINKDTELDDCKVVLINIQHKSLCELTQSISEIDDINNEINTINNEITEIIGSGIIGTYGFTSRNNYVLRGEDVTGRGYVEGFSTSDVLDIPSDADIVTYSNTYDAAGYFAGLVLYNEAYDAIVACFGGSGKIVLSDYPTAKKFAFCINKDTELSDCKVELICTDHDSLYQLTKKVNSANIASKSEYNQSELISGCYQITNNKVTKVDDSNTMCMSVEVSNGDNFRLYTQASANTSASVVDYVIVDANDNVLVQTSLKSAYALNVNVAVANAAKLYINCDRSFSSQYSLVVTPSGYIDIKSNILNAEEKSCANERALKAYVSQSVKVIDSETGKIYKIGVTNGEISKKIVKYDKVFVVGNSFTSLGSSSAWNPQDERGCAASVPENDYCSLLAEGLGSTEIVRYNAADWEQNHNIKITDTDSIQIYFDKDGGEYKTVNDVLYKYVDGTWNVSTYSGNLYNYNFANSTGWRQIINRYDAIIFCLGENIGDNTTDLQKDIESAIKYIKERAEDADIWVSSQWSWKDSYFEAAASAQGVNYAKVDNSTSYRSYTTPTYCKDKDGNYFLSSVGGHPDDYGAYLIANSMLSDMGVGVLTLKHNITKKDGDGGSTALSHDFGIAREVITLFVTAESGKTISSVSVKDVDGNIIKVTMRSSGVYTFLMPYVDVIVTTAFA